MSRVGIDWHVRTEVAGATRMAQELRHTNKHRPKGRYLFLLSKDALDNPFHLFAYPHDLSKYCEKNGFPEIITSLLKYDGLTYSEFVSLMPEHPIPEVADRLRKIGAYDKSYSGKARKMFNGNMPLRQVDYREILDNIVTKEIAEDIEKFNDDTKTLKNIGADVSVSPTFALRELIKFPLREYCTFQRVDPKNQEIDIRYQTPSNSPVKVVVDRVSLDAAEFHVGNLELPKLEFENELRRQVFERKRTTRLWRSVEQDRAYAPLLKAIEEVHADLVK